MPCPNIFIKAIEFQEKNIFQFIYTSANPTSRTIMKIPKFVKSNPFGNIKSIDFTNLYHGKCFQPCTNECEASYYKYAKEKSLMKRRDRWQLYKITLIDERKIINEKER